MNDTQWEAAVLRLSEAAEHVTILGRCLGVAAHLEEWKRTGEWQSGATAADGLDQARGSLERLADGWAADLLSVVEDVLRELPIALE